MKGDVPYTEHAVRNTLVRSASSLSGGTRARASEVRHSGDPGAASVGGQPATTVPTTIDGSAPGDVDRFDRRAAGRQGAQPRATAGTRRRDSRVPYRGGLQEWRPSGPEPGCGGTHDRLAPRVR